MRSFNLHRQHIFQVDSLAWISIRFRMPFCWSQWQTMGILFLDFHKAFDSVLHLFLMTLLRTMDFPAEYIAWILLLYTNASSMVRNKGWLLTKFSLERGVRQSCPLSCYLFNLVGQVTVYYLQSMGIFAWWTYKSDPMSLYEDDVALILEHI